MGAADCVESVRNTTGEGSDDRPLAVRLSGMRECLTATAHAHRRLPVRVMFGGRGHSDRQEERFHQPERRSREIEVAAEMNCRYIDLQTSSLGWSHYNAVRFCEGLYGPRRRGRWKSNHPAPDVPHQEQTATPTPHTFSFSLPIAASGCPKSVVELVLLKDE